MNGPPGPRLRGWVIALRGTENTGLGWMGPGRQREGELTRVQGLAAALAAQEKKARRAAPRIRARDPELDLGGRRWQRAVCSTRSQG